ncbi:MAG: DoxX family protein [Halofilum sp. (in: g-proteobacteria)]|nr:DoxX family protein [Halofilum sp. (in: g-proteobacteria)]
MYFDIDTAKADETGKLILRVVLGLLVLLHGLAKVIGGVDGIVGLVQSYGLPGFVAYGVYLGEVVGPLLLIIGWYARIGAVLIVINMIFALLLVHTGEFFMLNDNGGYQLELQMMFLFSAIACALMGPGRFCINRK